jgi:hypothetical protein
MAVSATMGHAYLNFPPIPHSPNYALFDQLQTMFYSFTRRRRIAWE